MWWWVFLWAPSHCLLTTRLSTDSAKNVMKWRLEDLKWLEMYPETNCLHFIIALPSGWMTQSFLFTLGARWRHGDSRSQQSTAWLQRAVLLGIFAELKEASLGALGSSHGTCLSKSLTSYKQQTCKTKVLNWWNCVDLDHPLSSMPKITFLLQTCLQ